MLTTEQKEIRKSGLGGSDIAAICGLSQYKTPLDVYMDKIGVGEDISINDAIYMGNKLEPVIADIYAEKTGKILTEVPTMFHKEMPYLLANVDRMITEDNAVLEIKTTNSRNEYLWGDEGTDQIPMPYLLQCAHYALITNATYVDIAVLIGEQQFRTYKYTRNAELEDKIVKKATQFWTHHVVNRIPPDPVNGKDTTKWWTDRQALEDKIVIATPDVLNIVEEFKTLKAEISTLEKRQDACKEAIQLYLGEKELLCDETGNALVKYKICERSTFDAKKLKEINAALYTQLSTSCFYRRMSV